VNNCIKLNSSVTDRSAKVPLPNQVLRCLSAITSR